MQSATRIAVKDISHEQPSWYHVTTLSNFVRGYDKYKRQYSKAAIGESTLVVTQLVFGRVRLQGDEPVTIKAKLVQQLLRFGYTDRKLVFA